MCLNFGMTIVDDTDHSSMHFYGMKVALVLYQQIVGTNSHLIEIKLIVMFTIICMHITFFNVKYYNHFSLTTFIFCSFSNFSLLEKLLWLVAVDLEMIQMEVTKHVQFSWKWKIFGTTMTVLC